MGQTAHDGTDRHYNIDSFTSVFGKWTAAMADEMRPELHACVSGVFMRVCLVCVHACVSAVYRQTVPTLSTPCGARVRCSPPAKTWANPEQKQRKNERENENGKKERLEIEVEKERREREMRDIDRGRERER